VTAASVVIDYNAIKVEIQK
jgi:hypothetical protein